MNYSQQSIIEKKNRAVGRPHKMRNRMNGLLRYLRGVLCIALFLGIVWHGFGFVEEIVDTTEAVRQTELLSQGDVSVLYDMEGNEIQEISDMDTDQSYVSLDQIPDCVRQAFVASQDEHFYEHHGMNIQEIVQNLYDGVFQKDGEKALHTTITGQLLQNRLDNHQADGDKTLFQWMRDYYLAFSLEKDLRKDEILEIYLNTINFGENILGVQAASKYYFHKDVWDVTISEAAVLAATVKDPERCNPISNQSENNVLRKSVMKSMLDLGMISKTEHEDALGDDVYLQIEREGRHRGGSTGHSYYVDAVLEQVLQDMKIQLGYTQTQAYNALYRCGVKIYTCQDTAMQKICDDALAACGAGDGESQASFVLIDQGTGEIKAIGEGSQQKKYLGNYGFREGRQPGTLFDILSTYAPGLDTVGMSLGSVENDAAYLLPDTLAPVSHWKRGEYKGMVTMRQSIRQGLSVPAVKTLEKVTIQTGYEYLKRFGITTLVEQKPHFASGETEDSTESDLQYSLALGKLTEGVTNLEMTAAYGAIANQGVYKTPRFYNKVVDSRGNVLLENRSEGRRIMKDTTAWLLTSAMRDKENDLSGRGEEKQIYVSGRYGLSDQDLDDWYEGFSPYYTGGIWIARDGKEQGNSAKRAKVIWKRIMEKVHRQRKISKGTYKKPVDIEEEEICTKCGNLAVEGLCNKAEGGSAMQKEYFAVGTQPEKNCTCHVRFLFCEDSGELASDQCPEDKTYTKVLLQKNEATETEDTPYTVAENITKELCGMHEKKIQVK